MLKKSSKISSCYFIPYLYNTGMLKKDFPLQSIIFDMDGVITNTMPDHFRTWAQAMAEKNINITTMDIYKREGQPGLQSLREIFAEYEIPFDEIKAKHILFRKEELFKELRHTRYIPGARSFLKHCWEEGFRLAIVTGTASSELSRILPMNLRRYFEVIITGSDVSKGKPHPEPYLKALASLKISPEDAIVIENAPYGIRSAKSAGLVCLALMTSLPEEYLIEADYIFPSYNHLLDEIQFLLKGNLKNDVLHS
jgi:beta-phosphoglucomutase